MREELRWTGQMLGGVRDLDVQLEYLAGLRQESGWDEATAIAPLVRRFEERRTEARAALLEALDSERYANLIASLRALLLAGPPEDAPAEESVALAHRIITRRYRRFQRDARALDHHSPLEAYHALRIRGKRLRYSLELFIDLYVPEATEALRPLRRFQDQLGELQDLATMNEDLRGIVATNAAALPADTLVMIGRMMERHQLRATRIIEAYPRRAARVLAHYPRLRRAMRLLRERRTDAGVPEVNDGEDASDEAMIEPQPARPETLADRMPVPVAPTELPRSLSRRLVGAVARLFR
jgi:CHAD domain-containing protein